jgi:PAS domain S-box-containing protein
MRIIPQPSDAVTVLTDARAIRQTAALLPLAVLLWDSSTQITYCNLAAEEMFGYPEQALLQQGVFSLVDDGDTGKLADALQGMGIRQVQMLRLRCTIPGGRTSRTAWHIVPVEENGKTCTCAFIEDRSADGQPGFADSTCTERKRTEDELRKSEKKFRDIFNAIDDIYFHVSLDGIFDLVSPSIYQHLGYQPEEVIGKSSMVFYANEGERTRLLENLQPSGAINDFEINLKHRNGAIIPFSITAKYHFDENGKHTGIEGIIRNILQRKQHEKILRNNEQRFRRIFESIQDVYFRAEKGIILFVSPSCKNLFGYAPEEMIGQASEVFYADKTARKKMLHEFARNGVLSDYEIEYIRKDGKIVTCSMNSRAVHDDSGEMIAMEGTLRDISTRKESEIALRESERRFRRIFESFHDVYYEADMNGDITLLSPSVEEHFGYSQEELLGKSAVTVYANPAEREEFLSVLLKQGSVNDYELTLLAKNGEIIPSSCSAKLVLNDEGAPVGLKGVLRDISQRKKADADLRQSEARFRSIFNSIPDAFLELNCLDTVVNASPSVSQFGFTQSDLIGRNISTLFADPSIWKSAHQQLVHTRDVKDLEVHVLTRNETLLPVSLTAYLIDELSNASSNIVCILRDISQQKQNEEELALARDKALEANRAKSAFLANMSHELRTPLNAIIGYSEMLLEDANEMQNEELHSDLQKIRDSGQHLLSLINEVLDLSKIEAGKMELNFEDIDIPSMLHEIVVTAAPLARKNQNQFTYSFDESIKKIHADKVRLKQAIYNLLANACKFTQQGSVHFSMYRESTDGHDMIHFNIRDTGIGITPEQMQRLFYEFTQADSSTTREYGGTGLGLVISQRFVAMMGGKILAESAYGSGSTFTIELPA